MKKLLSLFLSAALLFSVSSCSIYKEDDFSGGTPVDSSIIEEARNLAAGTEASKYTKTLDSSGNRIVFWTEGGSAYHGDTACTSLSKSKVILSGSISEAVSAGKIKSCSICFEE